MGREKDGGGLVLSHLLGVYTAGTPSQAGHTDSYKTAHLGLRKEELEKGENSNGLSEVLIYCSPAGSFSIPPSSTYPSHVWYSNGHGPRVFHSWNEALSKPKFWPQLPKVLVEPDKPTSHSTREPVDVDHVCRVFSKSLLWAPGEGLVAVSSGRHTFSVASFSGTLLIGSAFLFVVLSC